MSTQELNVDQVREIDADRLPKVLAALAELGWKYAGEAEHPIRYPWCHKVVRGEDELFVAPAVEDYKCVTVWNAETGVCIINSVTMRAAKSVETKPRLWEFVDTDQTLADVPEIVRREDA